MKKEFIHYYAMPYEKVLKHFDVNANGLSSEDAQLSLQKYGENTITKKKRMTKIMLFINQFKNPIIVILLVATAVSAITGEWIDAMIILLIILGSGLLSFFQEYSASNAIEELRAKVQATTNVLRDGKVIEIPSSKIV
ncbi:MAG: cation-transporting P-type ATPase, partial [Carnobacterium sp.]